jgi:5'-nucleotidase
MAGLNEQLVIAISSRALFDLSTAHEVFVAQGVAAYQDYQVAHENDVLAPGGAFHLVKKLLALNSEGQRRVEILLLSRNTADTGLRVFNAIRHYGLDITRAAFTGGASTSRYIPAFGADLFLSADAEDVREALNDGFAAARIMTNASHETNQSELRIAFDGDAVLFSDEAEQVFQRQGLKAFSASEAASAHLPLSGGPFKNFLTALHRIQAAYPRNEAPIRTALVTARSAPAHERVIRTLRAWGIRIDEALFLGGLEKAEFLQAFAADIFFDDQERHIDAASQFVTSGHVPHGIINQAKLSHP